MDSFIILVTVLHVIFMFSKSTDCQVLSTCVLPIYNQECEINCTTPDQSKIVTFYKLPDETNPFGLCSGTTCQISNDSLKTMYSIQSTDSITTTLRINNLVWDDKGTWRCDYDVTPNTTVLGFAKYPDDIEYSGLSNNSDIESGTVMPITMKCLYTEIPTSVTVIYLSTGGTARSTPVTCTDTTSSCANINFVSKLCRPKIQVGAGVVCDGNYSIEIATSVLGNEERKYSVLTGITVKCPISEMSTSIDTERMTGINSISELSNTTLPMISGSTTTTSIETTNIDANTQTNEIHTNTLRSISNYMSTLYTTTDISGSFKIPIQIMTETFTMTGYTISSYNEIISPSTFETITVFPQIVSKTSISLSVDTHSDSLLNTIRVSSGSKIATDSTEFSILSLTISPSYVGDSNISSFSTLLSVQSLMSDIMDSAFEITNVSHVNNLFLTTDTVKTPVTIATVDKSAVNTVLNSKKSASLLLSISENNTRIQEIDTNTESPLMSTTFIDQILYSSKIKEPSDLSETSLTLSIISVSSQSLSSIIDTMDRFIYSTNTLITSYLDDSRHSFMNSTSVFKTFSPDYAASASIPLPYFIQSMYHSSLQTTEYYATIQTEFTSYATPSFYESNTHNAATEIYSKRKVTSAPPNMHISAMPSQTQLSSMNDIQDSTNHFQSTYLEPYFQSTDELFSSKDSEYVVSTLRSTSFLLSFNTNANASRVDFSMKTTNMLIFETQSDIPTISADLSDFETTRLMTTIDFSNETILSMIKPSSQQKNTDNSYIEIDTSFKDSLFSSSHVSGSLTSNFVGLTTLSMEVFESMSSPPTNTVQNGLSEKNKTIIFIGITSTVITFIIVILLIIFVRMNISKHNKKIRKEDDININWSNCNSLPKTFFPDYSFTRKSIHPLMNTSSASFTMRPYEHNWKDIV